MRSVRSLAIAAALVSSALVVPSADAVVRSGETRRLGNSTDVVAAAIDLSRGAWDDDAASIVVLGRSDLFPDTLAGAALASTRGPVLFTSSATLAPTVKDEIERVLPEPSGCDGTSTIAVLGGTGAISSTIGDQLAGDGWCVERYAGNNRVETAVQIAHAVLDAGGDGSRVLLASAANWPDAATGSAYAAATGHPIVVTFPDTLDPTVAQFLRDTAPEEIVLLGGTAALSPAVETAARSIAPTRRVAGTNRDDTAVAIADELWAPLEPTGVALVNGYTDTSWAYAIASAVSAALDDAAQLFVDTSGMLSVGTARLLDRTADTFSISVGPTSLVPSASEVAVRARRDLEPIPGPGIIRYRDPFAAVEQREAIRYGRPAGFDGTAVDLLMDVYEPADDTVDERPLLVFVHGGGFFWGDRNTYDPLPDVFAARGWVVASIDYRLIPNNTCNSWQTTEDGTPLAVPPPTAGPDFPAACMTAIRMATDDVQTAVRYLQDHAQDYGIDAGRIAVMGHSAGGVAALHAGWSRTEEPDAAIDAVVSVAGAGFAYPGARDLVTRDPGDAPSLMFASRTDELVPYDGVDHAIVPAHVAALAAGQQSVLYTIDEQAHDFLGHWREVYEQATRFLWRHLDLEHAAR